MKNNAKLDIQDQEKAEIDKLAITWKNIKDK